MKKTKERVKRASKLDLFITAVTQDWAHHSTDDITRRRIVLACEANTLESEIAALTAKIADARLRRTKLEATINALSMIIEKR